MKLKSTNIIDKRTKLSKDITHYWTIIRRENMINKKMTRNYDLTNLHNTIVQKAEQRVKTKLLIQAINMGYKIFELDKFINETNYYAIYQLSELNEQLVQLDIVLKYSTIDPTLKAKKGKNGCSTTEHFTSAKLKSMKKKLQLEINALNKKIEDFNTAAEIEASDDYAFILAA